MRRGDRSVMLSAAKHLSAQRDRPCAAAQGDSAGAVSSSGLFSEVHHCAPTNVFICIVGNVNL